MEQRAITEELAGFISSYDSLLIPDEVKKQAVRSLVNWIACALGGANHPAVTKALEAIKPFAGNGHATVIGRSDKLDALNAALLNGISSHVLDFDDTHLATLVHPSGPVISALFALSEYQKIDGNLFIESVIYGIEMECRVARGVCPAHYDRGWHVTSTAGVFGAAAATGRALGLSQQKMAWAFGLAATQASGLREMFGSMTKSFHPGHAAQCGLRSAFFAQAGFTSSTRGIEAPRGFANVLSTERNLDMMIEGLGSLWLTNENSFKPYACGLVIHPVIDGCLHIKKNYSFESAQIEKISLLVNPLVLELTGKKQPVTGLEGKFSVQHSAAIVLLEGVSKSKQYSDAVVGGAEVTRLRNLVQIKSQSDIRIDEAYIELLLSDGTKISHHVEHALGSLERPMTNQDIDEKYYDLTSSIMSKDKANRLLSDCWNVESLDDVGKTLGKQLLFT